ncbi:MAG: hypothetical protein WB341_04190 [Terracidiphilus sp.]
MHNFGPAVFRSSSTSGAIRRTLAVDGERPVCRGQYKFYYNEWVAFECANVREFYGKMGIGDRTEIEFFNGPHMI